jgi:hypothetical protein
MRRRGRGGGLAHWSGVAVPVAGTASSGEGRDMVKAEVSRNGDLAWRVAVVTGGW